MTIAARHALVKIKAFEAAPTLGKLVVVLLGFPEGDLFNYAFDEFFRCAAVRMNTIYDNLGRVYVDSDHYIDGVGYRTLSIDGT